MAVTDDRAARAKAFPPDWWKAESVAGTLAKCFAEHLVALEVAFLCGGRPEHVVYTGFLLRFGPLDLWVTSGRMIGRIRRLLDHPKISVVRAGLLDGYDREGAKAVPVPIDDLPLFSAEPSLDFGTAFLREAYVAPITANPRFRPLTPVVWQNHEKAQPEGHYLVSMPKQWVEVRDMGTKPGEVLRRATMGIACIPVERIEPTGGEEPKKFWGHPGAFYGRLLPIRSDDGARLERIVGMSGGPVLSIERTEDGHFRYYLFGIQSAWLASRRIIRAASISHVASLIREGTAYALEQPGPWEDLAE